MQIHSLRPAPTATLATGAIAGSAAARAGPARVRRWCLCALAICSRLAIVLPAAGRLRVLDFPRSSVLKHGFAVVESSPFSADSRPHADIRKDAALRTAGAPLRGPRKAAVGKARLAARHRIARPSIARIASQSAMIRVVTRCAKRMIMLFILCLRLGGPGCGGRRPSARSAEADRRAHCEQRRWPRLN